LIIAWAVPEVTVVAPIESMLKTNVWPAVQMPYGVAVEARGVLDSRAYYPVSRSLLNVGIGAAGRPTANSLRR